MKSEAARGSATTVMIRLVLAFVVVVVGLVGIATAAPALSSVGGPAVTIGRISQPHRAEHQVMGAVPASFGAPAHVYGLVTTRRGAMGIRPVLSADFSATRAEVAPQNARRRFWARTCAIA